MGQRGSYIKNVFGGTDIALCTGERLLIGRPCAFGDEFHAMIRNDRPSLTERIIRNISEYASHGGGRMHEILLSVEGFGHGPLSQRGASERVLGLMRQGVLLALVLPAVTLRDIKTSGADLEHASGDIEGAGEVNTKIGGKGTKFSDLKSMKDKLVYVIKRCPDYFSKRKVLEAFKAALTPLALISVAVVLAAWAASHFAGVGFAIDAVLLAIGWVMIGWGIFSAMKKLLNCLKLIKNANSLADLDKAAEMMADAIVMLGVDTFIGLLTRGAGKLKRAPGPKQKTSGGGASGSKSKADVKAENQAKADAKKKADEDAAAVAPKPTKAQLDTAKKLGVDPKWVNPDGSIKWPPNDGFDGPSTTTTLKPPAEFDRYGGQIDPDTGKLVDGGSFTSPTKVPFDQRSVPPSTLDRPFNEYLVKKPIPGVESGKIAPWFDQPGGGTQYKMPMSIDDLIDGGYIERIGG